MRIFDKHITKVLATYLLALPLWGVGGGLLFSSCSDDITAADGSQAEAEAGQGIGEMVLFTSGTTINSVTTRADGDGDVGPGYSETLGKTYYMPDGGRFVCRMYSKASASTGDVNDKYDVSGNTDVTTWMKVSGTVGNSLYWNKSYPETATKTDTYGNDDSATHLYWQNRKEHAFLAWTDFNKLKTIGYSPDKFSGALKFEPEDEIYLKHTGEKSEIWVRSGYELYGIADREFSDMKDVREFLEESSNYDLIKNKAPEGIDFTDQQMYYEYGWSCKYRMQKDFKANDVVIDELHQKTGWVEYQMFYDKLPYNGATSGANIIIRQNAKGVPTFLYDNSAMRYLAQIDIKFYEVNDEGQITNTPYTFNEEEDAIARTGTSSLADIQDGDKLYKKSDGDKTPIAQCKFVYNLTDDYGNEKYDETRPRYIIYYRLLEEKKNQEVVKEYKANVFDLTRKPVLDGNITSYGINSISEQPDILQALTKQTPIGATQESNRVNLYFKHQFSQVQVNIKGSADMSVVINKDHIRKVELLGVSEKGYVFTEMDADGNVEPSTYESVDVSKYSDEHLAKNQYGTAFDMFDMYDAGKPNDNYGYALGYLKSYNALTFGQLQAIRVTWTENPDGTGTVHESTYHVADERLKNLQSGKKYIWNIELRRGTLAIVRTEIVNWIVPTDGTLEYNTNGTIQN